MKPIDPSLLNHITAGATSGPTPLLLAPWLTPPAPNSGVILLPGSLHIEPQPEPWKSGVYLGH
jgi:hypothetical protein